MSKIVAIDFETANVRSASAISIGYAVIEENLIVDYNNYLLKPHETVNEFLPQNIRVHHITPDMVENAPSFEEIYYDKLKDIFQGAYLIAHNAPFDMRVLKSLFNLYNIPITNFKYFCTVEMSNNLWPNLTNHKLPTVAEAINYNLNNHHNAKYDALACAKIVTAAMKDLNTTSFYNLCFLSKTKIGTILNTKEKGWNELRYFRPNINNLIKMTDVEYTEHPYYSKNIAQIGEFSGMSMLDVAQHLFNVSGHFDEYILNDTDYVVLSDKYFEKTLKPKYIKDRINIAINKSKQIISETEFKENLFSHNYLDNKSGLPKYKQYEYL